MSADDPSPAGFLPLTPLAFEILLAVGDEPRHGYDVMLAVERRTGGQLNPNPGTLYRAIDRLVQQGLLDVEQIRQDGGEPRRTFGLSGLGGRVVSAEAARLADQVEAARALRARSS